MAANARLVKLVEVVANLAVISVAVALLWGVSTGRLMSSTAATKPQSKSLVEDIEKDGLTTTVKLMTHQVRLHHPVPA